MKAELKRNNVNQIIKGTNIFEAGDEVTEIGLVIKGRVCVQADGVKTVIGSGNFLGLCDLTEKVHRVTYTADTNLAVYAFEAGSLSSTIRNLIKANKDYAPLMVSTLSKYIKEISKIFDTLENATNDVWQNMKDYYQTYLSIGKKTGAQINVLRSIENLPVFEAEEELNLDKVEYYRACAELPTEIRKAYFGANMVITIQHITEQVEVVNSLFEQCKKDAVYLKGLAGPLVLDDRSLYMNVLQQATVLQHLGTDISDATSLLDDVIDQINSLENLLLECAGVDLQIDHEFMEEAYFELLNGSNASLGGSVSQSDAGEFALVEDHFVSTDELMDAMDQILSFAEIDSEKEQEFRSYIHAFEELGDKFSTEDTARTLRRNILKAYYPIYKAVFLKDYHSSEKTPLVIDLFLRFGFLSERLITEDILEELATLDISHSGTGACDVYDMKEWLTLILEGKKEPSKSEFDMDYDENLRDMKRTGQITAEQQQALSKNLNAKFEYEIQNMFRTNHRLLFSQVTAFVPFLFTEGCTTSISKSFLAKDRVNAAIQRLLQIDFSVFYRESLYAKEGSSFAKEYIQQEVFPDVIVLPGYGNKGVMWQELSGRRRTSKGRFLLPIFMESDLEAEMVRLFGRFRWELCRTIQGAAWNNIQVKSLTSEYADFIQFYKKNRDLSEDKKEKLKMQIQKCRNNTREVFVSDYENWIRHEAQGGMCLSKPVREIMATYCPFTKELREKVSDMPIYRDAMARFQRERGKKLKEYDLKFKVWQKDGMDVPQEVVHTRDFYLEF